eukprot:gene8623-34066_t
MAASISTVSALRPGSKDVSLVLKIVETKATTERSKGSKGVQQPAVECIAGDETGVMVLVLRKEQGDLATKGAFLKLEGAKVEMVRGSMKLVVGASGTVEAAEGQTFSPLMDNNLSLIEFEMVSLAPQAEAATA